MHLDAIAPGEPVLLVDDLIATGGTATASIRLIEQMGGRLVEAGFVIDLPDLGGRRRLEACRTNRISVQRSGDCGRSAIYRSKR